MFVVLFTDIHAQSPCDASGLKIKYFSGKSSPMAYIDVMSCLITRKGSLVATVEPVSVQRRYFVNSHNIFNLLKPKIP